MTESEDKVVAALRALETSTTVVVSNLPDGEYPGLGSLRASLRDARATLAASRDKGLGVEQVKNTIAYYFDTHRGQEITLAGCDVLIERIAALSAQAGSAHSITKKHGTFLCSCGWAGISYEEHVRKPGSGAAPAEPWCKPFAQCDWCGRTTHDEREFGKSCSNGGGFMREKCRGIFRLNPMFEKKEIAPPVAQGKQEGLDDPDWCGCYQIVGEEPFVCGPHKWQVLLAEIEQILSGK